MIRTCRWGSWALISMKRKARKVIRYRNFMILDMSDDDDSDPRKVVE